MLCAGCRGAHSVLSPAGPQSQRIASLYWLFLWVCVVVWVLVVLVMLLAVWRRRRTALAPAAAELPAVHPDPLREKRIGMTVGTCVGITVVILFVLLFGDYVTGRSIHQFSYSANPVSITVTGHQWWWEFRYEDKLPVNLFTTANEIHIPTGRPVRLFLQSADVIHSFWVPNLAGKKDLIPNHSTEIWLQADKPGTYYGQCAEYCGYEHALMRMVVVADEPAQFDAWLFAQRQVPPPPTAPLLKHGQQVFLSSQCVMCHTITGTPAGGRVGPDLTHVGSRSTLAAGALPNMPGHLAGWIIDPQRIKPGVKMPQNNLNPQDLRAVLEYLDSLK
jgi:cytochrome c oxidase subunit 2